MVTNRANERKACSQCFAECRRFWAAPIFDYLRARIFDWRRRNAIREAQASADLYRKKFLVLVWHGRPVVVSMQGVKDLIRRKRFHGLTAEKARRIAIFEATPRTFRANESRTALAQVMPNVAGNGVKHNTSAHVSHH